jgi:dienelactone hydrolase
MTRFRLGLPALLLALTAWSATEGAPGAPRADDPPDAKRQRVLCERFLELGPRAVGEARAEQRRILAELALLPPLDAKAEAKWREELLELWAEGPELEKRGRNHLFEDDRGLYYVGGRTKKPVGLLIGMHGGGVGQGDASAMASLMDSPAGGEKWVAIFPEVLEKTEHGWTTSGTEEFVLELVDRARRTFDVDPDRVYFSGHSMGGFGTWTLGAHHADQVAGLAASAGAPTPILDPRTHQPVDIDWGVIPNLRNVRLVAYQSLDDPQVPPDANQLAARQVAAAREKWGGYGGFEYWEVTGHGHDAPPGGYEALFEKISGAVRDPRPTKVIWQPVLSWKRQFYWLHWEQPPEGAVLVAELDREANEVRLECDRPVEGLSLLLGPDLLDLRSEVVVRLNGQVLRRAVPPPPSLAALLETGVTGDPGRTYAVRFDL